MPPPSSLHLLSSDRFTGPAQPVCQLLEALAARGHRVWIGVMPGRSLEEHVRARDIPLVEELRLDRGFAPLSKWRDRRHLTDFVAREKVALVHCHSSTDHWLAVLAQRLGGLGVPIVRTQHRIPDGRAGAVQRWLWQSGCDAVIAVAQCQIEGFPAAPPAGVHLVPGAVDTEAIRPMRSDNAVRKELGISPGAPVVGMISHFKAGRGWARAVEALIRVHRDHPAAHFILAGGHSRLVKRIRVQMDEAGCLERTHIITDRRFDWPDVLAAMDMSLWLAVQSDGSGRAMLEVMAAGRPVIAAAVGAAPDTIRDGESGLLVPADVGAADLAQRVSGLIRDDVRRHRLGEAARRAIEVRHTLPMQAESVERVYEAVLRRRSGDR